MMTWRVLQKLKFSRFFSSASGKGNFSKDGNSEKPGKVSPAPAASAEVGAKSASNPSSVKSATLQRPVSSDIENQPLMASNISPRLPPPPPARQASVSSMKIPPPRPPRSNRASQKVKPSTKVRMIFIVFDREHTCGSGPKS